MNEWRRLLQFIECAVAAQQAFKDLGAKQRAHWNSNIPGIEHFLDDIAEGGTLGIQDKLAEVSRANRGK